MKAATDKLSITLRAVADPTRRKILRMLRTKPGKTSDGAGMNASDIEQRIRLAQPTVSHHMKMLKQAGLIETKKTGTFVWYRRNEQVVRMLRNGLQEEV